MLLFRSPLGEHWISVPVFRVLRCDAYCGGAEDSGTQSDPRCQQRLLQGSAVWGHEGGQSGTCYELIGHSTYQLSTAYLVS